MTARAGDPGRDTAPRRLAGAVAAVALLLAAPAPGAGSAPPQSREPRPRPESQERRGDAPERAPVATDAVVAEDPRAADPLRTVDVVQGGRTTLRPELDLAPYRDSASFRVVRSPCSIASTAGEPQVESSITAALASGRGGRGPDRRTLEPARRPSLLVIAASKTAEPGRYARLQAADAAGDWQLLPICIRVTAAADDGPSAGTPPRERTPEPAPAPQPIAGGDCPGDYFSASEIAAAQATRFRFPIPDPVPEVIPEPGVIHMDRDRESGASKLDCVPYQPGHLCYDNHEGTDFSLSGHVVTMSGGVQVVAAADGVVQNLADGHPDLCTWVPPDRIQCLKPNDPWNFDETPANYVEICHPDGTRSRYYHLQAGSVGVTVGQSVSCGDHLGRVGSSGHSSAPHLHFDVQKRGPSGAWTWVDPYAPRDEDSLWTQQHGGLAGSVPGPQCQ